MIEGRRLVEMSYDIESGLGGIDVPDFESLRTMGMAATLAVHLRGMPEISYEVLRKVSEFYFSVPSIALKELLHILADIEFVELITVKGRIDAVIPKVPRFQDLYDKVGNYFTFSDMNEHEQGTLLILSELQNKPENKDRLLSATGIDHNLYRRCLDIGKTGNYFKEMRARGRDILLSPFYFADNLDGLADLAARSGGGDIKAVLDIVKENQGWPLSLIEKRLELGGKKLTENQRQILNHLCSEGILKPPSIEFNGARELFVFTPRPGAKRLDSSNREIYERAMALVSCVRKGQLLAEKYRIRMPVRILEALRDKGYIGSNSEAWEQYRNLAFMRVGRLEKTTGDQYKFSLIKTEENVAALELAISLLRTGEMANLDVNNEARLALSKDESYIQSILSAAELKKRNRVALSEEAAQQFEQLILV